MTDARQPAGALPVATPLGVRRDRVFLTFLVLTFAFAVVFLQHISTLPVQMADDGLGARGFGFVISVNAVLIILVTRPVSRRLQRFPTSRVLTVSSIFLGLGFGATAWASTIPAYLLTVLVWTVGEVIGSSLAPAVVAELAPVQARGRYQGALTSTFAVAALAAPVAGGWVYDGLNAGALWIGCGVLSFAAGAGHLLAGPARQRRLEDLRREVGAPFGC